MSNQSPGMLIPALIAGSVFGFVSAIPILNMLNCLCCSLIIGAGFVAAFLYSRACGTAGVAFTAGTGAMVGLLAGLFYALSASFFGAIASVALGMGDIEQVVEQLRQVPNMDPQLLERISDFVESAGMALILLIAVVVNLVFGAIFATVGGLIGGALFKKEARAAF